MEIFEPFLSRRTIIIGVLFISIFVIPRILSRVFNGIGLKVVLYTAVVIFLVFTVYRGAIAINNDPHVLLFPILLSLMINIPLTIGALFFAKPQEKGHLLYKITKDKRLLVLTLWVIAIIQVASVAGIDAEETPWKALFNITHTFLSFTFSYVLAKGILLTNNEILKFRTRKKRLKNFRRTR